MLAAAGFVAEVDPLHVTISVHGCYRCKAKALAAFVQMARARTRASPASTTR
jgi:hypothetical protein